MNKTLSGGWFFSLNLIPIIETWNKTLPNNHWQVNDIFPNIYSRRFWVGHLNFDLELCRCFWYNFWYSVCYVDIFFGFFWVAKNVTSSIPKIHIFEHRVQVLKVFQKLRLLLYFNLCVWLQLKILSSSRIINPFSSLLKDCSFRLFRARKYFLNTWRWWNFVKNLRRAIFFKEWAFSEQFTEAATRGVLYEKVFLEISQNSQENTCVWGLQLY